MIEHSELNNSTNVVVKIDIDALKFKYISTNQAKNLQKIKNSQSQLKIKKKVSYF